MTSSTTIYRKEHPEWREQEKVRDRERFKQSYYIKRTLNIGKK